MHVRLQFIMDAIEAMASFNIINHQQKQANASLLFFFYFKERVSCDHQSVSSMNGFNVIVFQAQFSFHFEP